LNDEPHKEAGMSTEPQDDKVHELAGGWITERVGTKVPLFLKLAYVGFSIFGLYYLFAYWSGEVGHSSRGPFVEEFNKVVDVPGGAWLAVMAVSVSAFVVGLLVYAFRKGGDEGGHE
jgi:hypothetical protein